MDLLLQVEIGWEEEISSQSPKGGGKGRREAIDGMSSLALYCTYRRILRMVGTSKAKFETKAQHSQE